VASEIATDRVHDILASKPFPFEVQTQRTFPRDVPVYRPLLIEPPPLAVPLRGQPVRPLVRVYDVGVVSVTLRSGFEADALSELTACHKAVLDNGENLDQVARTICADVCKILQDVLVEGAAPSEPEAYTVFCLTDIGAPDVSPWLAANRAAVAELLAEAKPGGLSEMQIAEALRITRSYSKTDMVIIDWDAALVVDLSGYMDDVLYVLELANLQLEEYRVMDQRLDHYLDRAYDDLKRRRFGFFGTYSKTLRTLRVFRVDVTKLNDEVTHISKFFGDWYLARVYLGALERFYLAQWRQSVENRLVPLDQLYSVVNADINNRRMVLLEVLVVIFFAIDLVWLIFLKR
jgi:hypothetical protein